MTPPRDSTPIAPQGSPKVALGFHWTPIRMISPRENYPETARRTARKRALKGLSDKGGFRFPLAFTTPHVLLGRRCARDAASAGAAIDAAPADNITCTSTTACPGDSPTTAARSSRSSAYLGISGRASASTSLATPPGRSWIRLGHPSPRATSRPRWMTARAAPHGLLWRRGRRHRDRDPAPRRGRAPLRHSLGRLPSLPSALRARGRLRLLAGGRA